MYSSFADQQDKRRIGMRIGEAARQAGVNVRTLRYYERVRLLDEPERRASGYREYPADVVRRVRFIKRAQELGFALREVGELLALRDVHTAGSGSVGASRYDDARELALRKAADIDDRVRHLSAMRDALQALADSCTCGDGTPGCAIIESIDDAAQPEPSVWAVVGPPKPRRHHDGARQVQHSRRGL